MKLIFKARDITEAHIIAGLLKSNGIDAHVGGHYLQGGVGELAATEFATINVADENADSAISIIDEYEKSGMQKNITNKKNHSLFTVPLIVLALSVILMLLLAIAFGDYQ